MNLKGKTQGREGTQTLFLLFQPFKNVGMDMGRQRGSVNADAGSQGQQKSYI